MVPPESTADQAGEAGPAPQRPGLLLTKLYAPRVRGELVARPRLIEALNRGADRKLTLVSTPPGYGKSTLVVQWLAQAARPAAWVSLDEGDNDPLSFFAYVVAAIQSIDPGIAGETRSLLDEPSASPTRLIVGSLLNAVAAATRPFVLVLDDFHAIESPEIHRGIGLLLQHLPPVMHVIISTRYDPPLPLVRMRARGELLELRVPDLRFTHEESQELLQTMHKLDLSPSEIETIEARTEGWAVGLQLITHVVNGRSRERVDQLVNELVGNVRLVDDFLWTEAIQQQPPKVGAFLLRTSILDRFNADLCDAVTATADGSAMLRTLEQRNLFLITLDERGHWYRYHHYFADVVRDHLAREASEDEILALHRRAAAWYEAHELIEEAIRHAVAGRDWDRAIRLLRGLGAVLYSEDRLAVLRSWLQGLPTEVLDRDPTLCYWYAWTLTRAGQFGAAMRPLQVAERAWTAADDVPELGTALLLHAVQDFVRANPRRAIEHAQRALTYLPEDRIDERTKAFVCLGQAHQVGGDLVEAERAFARVRALLETTGRLWLQLVEMSASAGIFWSRGKLREAMTLSRRVIAIGDEWTHLQVQHAHCLLAYVYLDWNRLDEAERHLRRADELAEWLESPLHRVVIHQLLARIAWARHDAEAAYEAIESAIAYATQVGTSQFVRRAKALRARFWLTSNQFVLARQWANECDFDPYSPPEYVRQEEHLTIVQLLILEGRGDVALKLLDRLQEAAEAAGRDRDVLEMLVLRALAAQEQDDLDGAAQALDRAIEFGVDEGFVRIFADPGPRMIPLLRQAAARGRHREYVHRLLAAIDGTAVVPLPDQLGLAEPLSERELEVLRLVAVGQSNRDIGERLFISVPTVKKHLTNILGKLEVTNRTQAVDQARRMGLL